MTRVAVVLIWQLFAVALLLVVVITTVAELTPRAQQLPVAGDDDGAASEARVLETAALPAVPSQRSSYGDSSTAGTRARSDAAARPRVNPTAAAPPCTVAQIGLPERAVWWTASRRRSDGYRAKPFTDRGAGCAAIRANYRVRRDAKGNPRPDAAAIAAGAARVHATALLPRAASVGACALPQLAASPFAPTARVWFVGNSHLRQLVISVLCRYSASVASTRMLRKGGACRGCLLDVTVEDGAAPATDDAACVDERAAPGRAFDPAAAGVHEGVLTVRFTNGAVAYMTANVPHAYGRPVQLERAVEGMLALVGLRNASSLTHVVVHPMNSKFWASFAFNADCPRLQRPAAQLHRERLDLEAVIAPRLHALGFRGTLIDTGPCPWAERSAKARAALQNARGGGGIVAFPIMRRYTADASTPFSTKTDVHGHQSIPGSPDAVSELLLWLIATTARGG